MAHADYLKGKVLTGTLQEIAGTLAGIRTPPLEQLAKEEVGRLRHAFPSLTGDGSGVDIISAFGEEIGIDPEKLAAFMPKHSVFRNHTYLSDPYIMRDLFHDDKSLNDDGARAEGIEGDAKKLFFQPTTTWSKAGDGVFRFAIMHTTIGPNENGRGEGRQARRLRIPVVMLDNKKLDTILAHDGRHGPVLTQLHDMMATACHDYVHTTFLYYVRGNSPEGVQQWDERLAGGKQIWRDAGLFNYNYEVLASVGHRQVMQRIYDRQPEVKAAIIARVRDFSQSVDDLCASMRNNGEAAEAEKMERYLMTNYMRFAYHILKPDEPGLAWVKQRYGYIEKDLNMHNGKGLVSIIHAHEGVPGIDTGDRDIPFREWLNGYVKAHEQVMESQPRYMNRMEMRIAERQKGQEGPSVY